MIIKKCSQCKIEKPINNFYNKKSSKDGKSSNCKVCVNLCNLEYHKKNKTKISENRKIYEKANKKRLDKYRKNYRKKNKEQINIKIKECHIKNKEKYKKNKKEYYETNKIVILKRNKKWIIKNKEKNDKYKKEWSLEKRKNPEWRLQENLKSLFRQKIKQKNKNIAGDLFEFIDKKEIAYIEHLKKDKLWNEYCDCDNKNIQIDHIIPIIAYNIKNYEDIKKCWDPRNLQFLTKSENRKKHNKIDMSLIKKYNIEHLLPENYPPS